MSDLGLKIVPTPGTLKLEGFAKELSARSRVYMRAATQEFAKKVHRDLRENLPSEAADLRKAAKVGQVQSVSPTFAVYLHQSAQKVREEDKDRVILIVSRRRGPFVVPKIIRVLEDFSPWTLDTIPFQPDPRWATITQRKVSEWAVEGVRKDRKKDERKWMKELAGKVPVARLRKRKQIKAVSDLMLQSMMYEFGLGGKYHPHWRPAILKNMRSLNATLGRNRKLGKILSDPEYQGWKSWPTLKNRVSMQQVKSFRKFQTKLGILS